VTEGLHIAAVKFTIGEECLAKPKKRTGKKYQKSMLKLKDEYNNLIAKVNAVKALNKAPELWSASQLHILVKWYKREVTMRCQAKYQIYLLCTWRPVIVQIGWLYCCLKCHNYSPPPPLHHELPHIS
jgi:hypothetical protein